MTVPAPFPKEFQMKSLIVLVAFLSVSGIGCFHGSDFRSADPYGSTEDSSSANPFHNGSTTETRRITLMESCLNRLGHTADAQEECSKSVSRGMPGAYVVTRAPDGSLVTVPSR